MKQLDKIRELETSDKSVRWYQDMIRKVGLGSVKPASVMKSDIGKFVTSIEVGAMYTFFYDPKLGAKLPFYDTVPLVIVFRRVQGGFFGLNMHYLPPILRMNLLTKMMSYTNNASLTETTRFRLKWDLLSSAARFPGAKAAVKHYLYPQIQSRVLQIHPADWKKAIMLPIESFEGADKASVYRDSVRKMR